MKNHIRDKIKWISSISDKRKVIWVVSILLVVIFIGSMIAIDYLTYKPDEKSKIAMEKDNINSKGNTIVFHPKGDTLANMVFYQGGLVKTESYAVLGQKLADNGIKVFMPKMPLNLAILNNNAFNRIYYKNSGDNVDWYIGGHSLGGSSASVYLKNSKKDIAGIFFLGSYPVKSNNIEAQGMKVISIDATEDELINRRNYEDARLYLPKDTEYAVIEGGNHSNYGNYGFQRGDGEAIISSEEQQEITTEILVNWIKSP